MHLKDLKCTNVWSFSCQVSKSNFADHCHAWLTKNVVGYHGEPTVEPGPVGAIEIVKVTVCSRLLLYRTRREKFLSPAMFGMPHMWSASLGDERIKSCLDGALERPKVSFGLLLVLSSQQINFADHCHAWLTKIVVGYHGEPTVEAGPVGAIEIVKLTVCSRLLLYRTRRVKQLSPTMFGMPHMWSASLRDERASPARTVQLKAPK